MGGNQAGGEEVVAAPDQTMNIIDHPLNQAAIARAKRDKIDLVGVPIFSLAQDGLMEAEEKGLDLSLGEHEEDYRLAYAQEPGKVNNSLALLDENEITPEAVMKLPLIDLAQQIIEALTPTGGYDINPF